MPDALCCGKAFSKHNIELSSLRSIGFDIDVELASILIEKTPSIEIVHLSYNRRKTNESKKLRFQDGWIILKRILKQNLLKWKH